MWLLGGMLAEGVKLPLFAAGLELLVLAVIVVIALVVLYFVFKALLLALPAIILAIITWLLLHDYTLTAVVFIVTLVITLVKKL